MQPFGRKEFANHLQSVSQHAGFTAALDGLDTLIITIENQPLRCNLKPSYDAYCSAPDRLHDITSAHLSALMTTTHALKHQKSF